MPSTPTQPDLATVPERLLAFLDRLGAELDRRGDAVALLGLGSVGRDLHRLDEHSDADFFVVVDDAATRDRYLADIDWLEAAHPVVWSFENSAVGRKALLEGDLFAEYAVFSLADMATAGYPPGRIHWSRADAPAGLEMPKTPCRSRASLEHAGRRGDHEPLRRAAPRPARRAPHGDPLHPGVCRRPLGHDARPPRARARRRSRTSSSSTGASSGASAPDLLPLADLVPGYERNAHAAATLLRPARGARRARPDDRGRGARPHRPGARPRRHGAVELELVDEQARGRDGDQSRSGARVKPKRS